MPARRRPTDAPRFHFEDVELEFGEDKKLRVKPPSSPPPGPPQSSTTKPPKTNPLAANWNPYYNFYPQDKCPVCKKDIAIEPGLDFIGHTCGHRGTCVNKRCIREYYGSASKKNFCVPFTGEILLFCQAPGCNKEIEAWCYVETKLACSTNNKYVRPVPVWNPEADKAIAKAKVEWDRKERREKLMKKIKIWAAFCIPCYGMYYIIDEVLSR